MSFLIFTNEDDKIEVSNKKREILGEIYFESNWNKFVFESYGDSYFDSVCLQEIVDYLKNMR